MFKIFIYLKLGGVLLQFVTPGPGTYYIYSVENDRAKILASNFVTNSAHVSFSYPKDKGYEIFYVDFRPENR